MRTEDGYIIQQCLDGDAVAFGLLVEKYKKGIYALAYSRIDNFHDAQDITQEVFIKAYQGLRTLKRWDNFVGWLYRITANQCKDWIRASSRRPDGAFAEDQEPYVVDRPSVDSYRENMVYESVREALDSVPETYREVMTLRYFGGMTVKEMARFLGVSPGTIERRLKEARIRLKEEMVTMMSATYEQHSLPANFIFRIVEIVKRIRIHPMPRATGLPWGLSLAAGIMIAAMTLGSQMVIHQLPRRLVFSSDTNVSEVREIPVDILGAPGTSVISGRQGDTDGGGIDPRNPQNSFLLAPAKGGGTWTQKADMPTGRSTAGSAVVDGKIYVIGGAPVPFGYTAAVEEYDPATNTWTPRADMPTATQGLAAAAVDGIIYAIGGTAEARELSTVEAYDPATDTWTTKADMPTTRSLPAIAVVDGRIYVIGGMFGETIQQNRTLSAVEAYEPATDTWTTKADMPTARYYHAACVVDGRIYVSGGATKWGERSGNWAEVPTVEVYDTATDTWTRASDMPRARHGHSASAVDGKMYIIGGQDGETIKLWEEGKLEGDKLEDLFSIVYVYDPATDMWTTAADPLPTARGGPTAAVVDGKIYAIGGRQGNAKLSTVEEYDPGLPDNIAVTSPAGKLLTTWGKVRAAE
ncbi:sigma-70 family RNA polymerase sigma factor [Candidatus Poribacteria bacterium]